MGTAEYRVLAVPSARARRRRRLVGPPSKRLPHAPATRDPPGVSCRPNATMHLPDRLAAITLPGLPELPAWRWMLGATAALLAGVAKTGIPGMGILAVPLMVLAVGDARRSAAWLLPLLCVADVVAVVSYRRHAHARRLFALLPWVLVGMGAGA